MAPGPADDPRLRRRSRDGYVGRPHRGAAPLRTLGGILGGALGGLLFFALRSPRSDRQTRLACFDVAAFAFAPALTIGRFGCALAHDHPGTVTAFPLAVSLKSLAAREYVSRAYDGAGLAWPSTAQSMGFHDLGLYEFLFLAAVVVPALAYLHRHPRRSGFFIVAFAVLYLPIRFGLDTLRIGDARYLNLTPAQWVAAISLAIVPLVAMHRRKARFAVSAAVILGTAWACWGGTPWPPLDCALTRS